MAIMEQNEFLAHIRVKDNNSTENQTCTDHCRKSAEYAREALENTGLGNTAYLAALLHDMGKYKESYQKYLRNAALGKPVSRGSVVHTFAGVRDILLKYHENPDTADEYQFVTAEIIAYAIGAHHGLFDCIDINHKNGFIHRIDTTPDGDIDAVKNFYALCASEDEIDELFNAAKIEIENFIKTINSLDYEKVDDETYIMEIYYIYGLIVRLVSSAVMEGDRRDTAEFMSDAKFPQNADSQLWGELKNKTERKLSNLSSDAPINQARQKISQLCADAAKSESGIYLLNVPTGSGKTLASLRYALTHAEKYDKERIIYTSPLLSILEQNAEVIRDYISDDSLILEHHSNAVNDKDTEESERQSVLEDSWSAPIIITTLVQLLNTMFDSRTSSVRRFHSLANSVIIIDEVQTVPCKLLSLFNLTVSFLAEACNATIVLCSATQPCTENLKHPIRSHVENIVSYDKELWQPFRRTKIINKGKIQFEEIPDFAKEVLSEKNSLLIVCNKKKESADIFKALQNGEYNIFHLSAAMCTQHRRKALAEIYTSLADKNKKTICVATQVIEAGVDISFDAVTRFSAGMDNIIQSAGRCNRNGESEELSPVYIVQVNNENLTNLREIRYSKQATEELLLAFEKDKDKFERDLSSDEAINYYYKHFYKIQKAHDNSYHDYPIKNKPSMFNLLSFNDWRNNKDDGYSFVQAFDSAGKEFTVFDNNAIDVVVPYKEGEEIISNLLSDRAKYDIKYLKEQTERAKSYTVSVFSYQIDKLNEFGGIFKLANGTVLGLDKRFYDYDTGLITDDLDEVNKKCDTLIL